MNCNCNCKLYNIQVLLFGVEYGTDAGPKFMHLLYCRELLKMILAAWLQEMMVRGLPDPRTEHSWVTEMLQHAGREMFAQRGKTSLSLNLLC